MARIVGGILLPVLGLLVSAAEDDGQRKPGTPREQYQALLKESRDAPEALSKARSDEERKAAVARLQKLPLRFLQLAEEHPKDPVAVEALIQTVVLVNGTSFPAGGKDSPGYRALALLRRDHVKSDRLGRVCQQVVFGFHRSHELFLRAVLDKNPHPEVQALACLSLAQFLNNRLDRLDVLKDQDQPDLAERYHRVFGKDYLVTLQRQDPAKAGAEVEALFERVIEQYSDGKLPYSGTVGEQAKSELYEIRHLSVGKQAQEIEGEDQDGKRFKLSDYRGKVVLLYFWSEY